MRIVDMKCNRIDNPLGYTLAKQRLSWIVDTETAKKQRSCQVQVALDQEFSNIVHDSGMREDIDGIGYTLDLPLKPCTRYFWRVKVVTDAGEVESPAAWFETAKLQEPWQAVWITPAWEDQVVHPLLRKAFTLEKEIAQARLYICGLGLYEAEINGERVGTEYFTPYSNAYDKWIQYQTFDVTDLVKPGKNIMGALLGNGWYKGRFGLRGYENIYGDRFALLAELVVTYTDGTTKVIGTDETWEGAQSHILDGNIYDGEIQDARKLVKGWTSELDCGGDWGSVQTINLNMGLLQARRSVPVRIMEELKPVQVIKTPKGETVLDMGQNMVGWVRFTNRAPEGTQIHLQFGEELQDGCFYRENLRGAKAEFKYISNGEVCEVQPHFTFYGFRYVKVQGWPGEIDLNDFTGCVVYSELEQTGTIETSNPKVNRLFLNALWGQKGNFLDVPTDCPQRDERMGWTGDAQAFSGTACFNMDCNAFFAKFLYDLAQEQDTLGGLVPHVVPRCGLGDDGKTDIPVAGSAAWSEAATVIPWNLYIHYGDETILEQQLDSMQDYVDTIRRQDNGERLWNSGFHYGDWLALDGEGGYNPFGGTPTDLIATAYYAYSAQLVAKAALVLGKTEIATEYQQLADEVKQAFCDEFVTPRGRMAVDTQTSYVLALFMDLVPEEYRPRIIESLRKNLEKNNYFLQTGFVGTPFLCRVLSENGYNDLAYKLLLNEEYPGWLYQVNLGATTIWERWNSLSPDGTFGDTGMNSLNHYTYGSIVEWMYRNMCGINPIESAPGFRKVRLAPKPHPSLNYAKATLKTAAGVYESGWSYDDGSLSCQFKIPFNAEAELVLPQIPGSTTIINGEPLEEAEYQYESSGDIVIVLGPGRYEVLMEGK